MAVLCLLQPPGDHRDALQFLIYCVDVGGLALGFFMLWRRRTELRVLHEVLLFSILGAGLGIASAIAAYQVNLGGFGVMRLWCHVLFCVLAPLLCLRGMWLLRAQNALVSVRRLGAVFVVLGMSMMSTYLYASFVEPRWLETTRHVIESPRISAPLKVVVMADLQTDSIGAYEEAVFRAIDAERADLILLPGDYLQLFEEDGQDFEREQAKLAELFRGLSHRPRLGIFGVNGDTDYAAISLANSGVRGLEDETVVIRNDVQIVGLLTESSRQSLSSEMLRKIEAFAGLTIVVGHAPDYMNAVIEGEARPDAVMLAGHTHGGQVVVPGFGPLLTLTSVPRAIAAGGHFHFGPSHLIVSRGVGLERGYAPRIRLFCRPELVVLEFRPGS